METLERLRGVKAQVNDDDDAFIAEVKQQPTKQIKMTDRKCVYQMPVFTTSHL